MKPEGYSRQERIGGKESFSKLFEKGSTGKSRLLIIRALRNNLGFTRAAAAVGKVAGKANRRNRIKRRLRAAFRTIKTSLPQGWDLVMIARRGVDKAEFEELAESLKKAVLRATEDSKA